MNFEKLNQYPTLIAQASTCVNDLEGAIARRKIRMAEIEGWVDAQVSAGDYKNEAQRKVARFEILQAKDEYQEIAAELEQARDARSRALVELEMLRNQFAIEKLAVKAAIAQQLAGLDGLVELVGA